MHRCIKFLPEFNVDRVGHLVLDGARGAHGFGERLAMTGMNCATLESAFVATDQILRPDLGDLRAGGFDEVANLLYGCTLCVEAQRNSRSGKATICQTHLF